MEHGLLHKNKNPCRIGISQTGSLVCAEHGDIRFFINEAKKEEKHGDVETFKSVTAYLRDFTPISFRCVTSVRRRKPRGFPSKIA